MARRSAKRTSAPEDEFSAELPVLPVRDTVLFPRMVTPLFVGRERSLKAVEAAMAKDRTILVVAQREPEKEDISAPDLYDIGTEAVIGRVLKLPDGSSNVFVQGQRRVRIVKVTESEPIFRAIVQAVPESREPSIEADALMKSILALLEKCVELSTALSEEAYVAAMNADDPGWLADLVASSLNLPIAQRQEILETLDVGERLTRVHVILAKELSVLELQDRIQTEVQSEVGERQREDFLREQLKQVQRELGETDPLLREVSRLRERGIETELPEAVAKKVEEELNRLATLPSAAPEVGVIRTYLDWLLSLPWKVTTVDSLDLPRAEAVLAANHYGLPKVKERVLEYIAVRKLAAGKMRGPILCFVGPPGVGKTSLGRSIAEALGRKFVRVSLGGVRDEAEIRGHRRTYVGALPGRIIQTMRTAGTCNPLFMLDEIDKLGQDFRGDPSAALLEVLDPEQNSTFSDHYLDVPYDLSQVMFITTANVLDPIPPALRDRLEVIELPGYVEEEKLHIAKQFLIPKQVSEHGLEPEKSLATNGGAAESTPRLTLTFTDGALRAVIREYTREAGVRSLEREIGSVCRKVARSVAENGRKPRTIKSQALAKYLGPPRFRYGRAEEHDEVGVATGVYWTAAGGDLATVEATLLEGKGDLILTGKLGEVMKESAQAALSYTRARARVLGIPVEFHERFDVHIHLPAGAIPKDGPSAGITMAAALVSALTRRPVRRDVAMTGEITLRGRVLPVGGLKEKILAAHRAGIRTVVLPRRNEKDIEDVPMDVKQELEFHFVDHMDEVLGFALTSPSANGE